MIDILCSNFCVISEEYKLDETDVIYIINQIIIKFNNCSELEPFFNTITENNLLTLAVYYKNPIICDYLVDIMGYKYFDDNVSHRDTLFGIPEIFVTIEGITEGTFDTDLQDSYIYNVYMKNIYPYMNNIINLHNGIKYLCNLQDDQLFNINKYKYILKILLLLCVTKDDNYINKYKLRNIIKYKIVPLLFS
jgi:hypothetical protein